MSEFTNTTYQCVACMEILSTPSAVRIYGHDMCLDCFNIGIKPLFVAYLKNELEKPRWRGRIIFLEEVEHHFSPEFREAYVQKEREYCIRPDERIYCPGTAERPCSHYLGARYLHDPAALLICPECGLRNCGKCFTPVVGDRMNHVCVPDQDLLDAFKNLKQGKDYQRCPGCKTSTELSEGCNHMTCAYAACKMEFCFICGEAADDDSGHWGYGKPCPKWNQPGTHGARFDIAEHANEADDDYFNFFYDLHDLDLADPNRDNIPQDEPIMQTLRRLDRRALCIIEDGFARMMQADERPFLVAQMRPFMILLALLLQVYTLGAEQREPYLQLRAMDHEFFQAQVAVVKADAQVQARFPALLPIVVRWELANAGATGWQEELERQLRAMRPDMLS
ncbi:putative IBR domain, E3 ubiquitin ligase RBR family, TRIAD supradomain-containing protein [Septoria linicola]|nr:putative IBR domain, E3 ubiquitin ligase RBR family, TRIAD supradomain-containing protein [Septoria linicola]